jgi:hypothetical protein
MDLRTATGQLTRYGDLAPAVGIPTPRVGLHLAGYGLLLIWPWPELRAYLHGEQADLPAPGILG